MLQVVLRDGNLSLILHLMKMTVSSVLTEDMSQMQPPVVVASHPNNIPPSSGNRQRAVG
jgi:hypothetical protein